MADEVAEIKAARERLVSAGSARILCATQFHWGGGFSIDQIPNPAWRAIIGAGRIAWKAVGRPLLRLATHDTDFRNRTAGGFVDFAGRRSMIDYGSYAVLQIGGQEWSGRSGRAVSGLSASAAGVGTPLWLVDLINGTTGAEDLGTELIAGEQWRHFAVTASLADASAGSAVGLATPQRDQFDDLLRLALDVWTDAEGLRQVRFVQSGRTDTVTFSEFGVSLADLDWDRLPTFRSPGEGR
jgi:hypothetical protein